MTSSDCLRVGQKAPDFTATAVYDQEFKDVTLSNYKAYKFFSIKYLIFI